MTEPKNTPEPDRGSEPPVLQQVTLDIRQLVPFSENLPRCTAMCRDGTQCVFTARYTQNDLPTCGSHLGRPSTVFMRKPRNW